MKTPSGLKLFISVVVAAVVIVVGIGLYLSGTPSQARAEKFDQQRINQLMQISNVVQNYFTTKNALPVTLDELKNSPYAYIESFADPVTAERYAYRVVSSTAYELCATFVTDSAKAQMLSRPAYPVGFGFVWQHPVGKKCFELKVNLLPDKRTPFVQ